MARSQLLVFIAFFVSREQGYKLSAKHGLSLVSPLRSDVAQHVSSSAQDRALQTTSQVSNSEKEFSIDAQDKFSSAQDAAHQSALRTLSIDAQNAIGRTETVCAFYLWLPVNSSASVSAHDLASQMWRKFPNLFWVGDYNTPWVDSLVYEANKAVKMNNRLFYYKAGTSCKDDPSWTDREYGFAKEDGSYANCADVGKNPDWCSGAAAYSEAVRRACPLACGICSTSNSYVWMNIGREWFSGNKRHNEVQQWDWFAVPYYSEPAGGCIEYDNEAELEAGMKGIATELYKFCVNENGDEVCSPLRDVCDSIDTSEKMGGGNRVQMAQYLSGFVGKCKGKAIELE